MNIKYFLYKTYPTSQKEDGYIDEFENLKEVFKFINDYQKTHGDCPYIRQWEYNGDIFIDYGSWSSFFRIKKEEES